MPDPSDDLHGTGPQGNVAGSLASVVGGIASTVPPALLNIREGLYGQAQPTAEQLASGEVQIPSWQSAIPQAFDLGGQAQGGVSPAGAGFLGKLGRATGIKAYHVSNADFGQFNSRHIGSGEGTADEGHGFYFTTSPRVVKMYQQQALDWLEEPTFKDKTGKLLGTDDILQRLDKPKFHDQSPEKYTDSTQAMHEVIDNLVDGVKLPNSVDHAPFVNKVKELGIEPLKPKTYEVKIQANPNDFLHWNKPFKDQTPSVQQKLAPLVKKHDIFPSDTGATLYDTIGNGDDVKASAVLKKAGVPGITYKDPDVGSRVKNYVVFHDKIIKILKKYGMVGLVAGGSSHFSTSQTDEDPWATQQ